VPSTRSQRRRGARPRRVHTLDVLRSQSGLVGRVRGLHGSRVLDLSLDGGRAVRCGHRKFMLTNHKVYIRANYCMRLSFGVAAAATTQRAGVASICAMRTCSSASCLWSKVARIDMSGAAAAGNGPRLRWFWRRGCRLEQRTCLSCALAKVLQDLLAAVS